MAFILSPIGRWLVGAGLAVALVGGLWAAWSIRGHELASARALAAQEGQTIVNLQAAAKRAAQTQAVTNKSETANVAQQVQIRTVTQTIIQKVPTYVTPEADSRCILPVGFVRVFNASATGVQPDAVPAPAGLTDSSPSGIECSAVAAVIADNFGKYRSVAAQLNAHLDWDDAQEALAPSP